jgi:subtilase family serine protease
MAKSTEEKLVPQNYRPLQGSERKPVPGATLAGPADPTEEMSVTILLRRQPGAPALPDESYWTANQAGAQKTVSREDFSKTYGASKEDIDQIKEFARSSGLKVEESNPARRSVVLSGTVGQMSKAFAVTLGTYKSKEETYRGREGQVHLPENLASIVTGVFGLDNRRMAMRSKGPAQATVAITPSVAASLYDFPITPNATGQTIAVLEFGGGFKQADINSFFTHFAPGITAPVVTSVGVDGATNSPGGPDDVEVVLDIDVAGSTAPGAKVVAYFAPWTEQGWIDILSTSIHDTTNKPSVLSISWGWPELETFGGLTWTPAAMNALNTYFQEAAVLGVTVFAASGDNGSSCGMGDKKAHVLYPASDPYVSACGGTTISNVSGWSFTEHTWPDTGGGISDVFPVPSWQASANIPPSANPGGHRGRGIPDIAGNADPASGYDLYVNGINIGAVGGTSATAPLYAGMTAMINASLGRHVGFLNPTFYNLKGTRVFHDIADSISNASGGAPGYTSAPGWDACTGLGSVVGCELLEAIEYSATATPYCGVQFNGTLNPNQTQTWFTFNWPAVWNVIWSVMPVSPFGTGAQVSWKVSVQRANHEFATYWITVTNLTNQTVNFEGRYAILSFY